MSLRASRPQKGGKTRVGRAAELSVEDEGMPSEPASRTWSELPAHRDTPPSNDEEVPISREKLQPPNRELEAANAELRQRAQLLYLSHDAIFVWPLDGAIEYWNRGAEELYGYSADQAVGRVSHELLRTAFPEPLTVIADQLRKGGFWVGELRHRCRDGREVTVLSHLLMIRGEDGVERILEANRDISERKAVEHRLSYLATFPEQNPGPIIEADFQGRLRYKNPAATELFPELTGEGIGHPWFADWPGVVSLLRSSGESAGISRRIAIDGRIYQQVLYGVPDEQVVRGYGLDVTESAQAERVVRESERRFATAFLSGPVPIGIVDARTDRIIEVNDAWVGTYGWSREEALGKTTVELGIVSPDARQRALGQSLRTAGDTPELRVHGKGGKPLDLLVRTAELKIDGRPCLLTTSLDVTARKRAELALRENEDFLSFALATARIGAWDLDLVNHTAHRSLQHDRIFGYSELPEWTFEMFLQHVVEEDREAVERKFRHAVETRGDWSFECRIRRKDGEIRWIWAAGRHRTDDNGQVRRMAGTVQDITERKRAEELLLTANQQLAEADQRKNEFLAVLSHELRNPLAPIRNSLHIMGRVPPGSQQAQRAQTVIERQTGQLARLVDDLLDVTRISRNKIQLKRTRLELGELVRRTVEDHRSIFEGSGIALEMSLPGQPVFVDGDSARLAQVIGNLLHNASKFTPSGGQVRVHLEHQPGSGHATLRVADNGAGMQPDIVQRLFQPFMQAEMTLDRTKGGLGLGLALVKTLVELHGGKVSAFSPGSGQGSEFVIELPADPVGQGVPQAEEVVFGRRPRRVLIIEDNVDAADSLKEVLEFTGNHVEVAYTGFEGLERARRFGPEIVLCDIGLPQMDGYEVAKAFKADESLRGISLIALSGYALPEDIQRSAEVGFERHLAKPPSLEVLQKLLQDLPEPGRTVTRP